MLRTAIACASAALLLLACASVESQEGADQILPLIGADGVYTLTDLHPDDTRSKLYAVNYQQDGLIPLCTRVKLVALSRKRLQFEVVETGRAYTYDYHKAAVDPFPKHLSLYFGRECNTAKVKKLSAVDQKGIRAGKVIPGMTRLGVIYAVGYPPPHRTPSLDADRWIYWLNRFKTMTVIFDENGSVTRVEL